MIHEHTMKGGSQINRVYVSLKIISRRTSKHYFIIVAHDSDAVKFLGHNHIIFFCRVLFTKFSASQVLLNLVYHEFKLNLGTLCVSKLY